jgi:hypothetical protein
MQKILGEYISVSREGKIYFWRGGYRSRRTGEYEDAGKFVVRYFRL